MAKVILQEEFEKRINERYPKENFQIISYKNMSSPLEIKCLKCNKILSFPQAKNFLAKNKKAGCSDCSGLRAKMNNNLNQLQQQYEIIKIESDELGKKWYTCKCKKCGRITTHTLINFLENKCRCEGKGAHWTEEEFKRFLVEEYQNKLQLLTDFTTVNDKSLFKCSCGHTWYTTPAHIIYNKSSCPICSKKQSKGSKVIEERLQQLSISYEKERFLENSLQRFDFYIIHNSKKYAIEYNGEQHYKYNPFFHGHDIESFYKYQERDKKKEKYCKDNNIELITIPYTLSVNEIKAIIDNTFDSSTTIPTGSSFK